MIQDSRLVIHEAGSHTFSGLRGLAISVPLGFDSLAPQHSTPNVGGETLRENPDKNLLLESWSLRISLLCQKWSCSFQVHKIKTISVVRFLKLQPNPISTRLALTHGCMANSSDAVRMDLLFEISTFKKCETEKYS